MLPECCRRQRTPAHVRTRPHLRLSGLAASQPDHVLRQGLLCNAFSSSSRPRHILLCYCLLLPAATTAWCYCRLTPQVGFHALAGPARRGPLHRPGACVHCKGEAVAALAAHGPGGYCHCSLLLWLICLGQGPTGL